MKELLNEVQASVFKEYERAAEKFGPSNNSPHESYAVILEEYEEAKEQSEMFRLFFEKHWQDVKANKAGKLKLRLMQEFAEAAAAEWIQVAAMCHKAQMKRGESDGS